MARRVLLDRPYRRAGDIDASGHANEVGKRQILDHRRPQGSVVGVVQVCAPVLVTHATVITNVVPRRLVSLRRNYSPTV